MANDYIRREDAVKASLEFTVEYLGGAFDEELQKGLKNDLESLEPADVVPVVRCRDCKHWKSYYGRCYKHDEYGMASDDFCSYGERKEEYEID